MFVFAGIFLLIGIATSTLLRHPTTEVVCRIMNIFSDVAKELLNMFMADARLALSVLGLVVFISLLIKVAGIAPCWQAAVF